MIGSSKYYLGGYNATSQTSQDMYSYERKIANTTSNEFYYGSNPNSWVGKLGLMYESDYGYASANCETKELINDDSTTDLRACNDTNWLYNIKVNEWFLPQKSCTSNGVFFVHSDGDVLSDGIGGDDCDDCNMFAVRPVLYLTSAVKITGGEGTENSPYTLGL